MGTVLPNLPIRALLPWAALLLGCPVGPPPPAPVCPEGVAPLAEAPGCEAGCPAHAPAACGDTGVTEQRCVDDRDGAVLRVLVDDRGAVRTHRYFREDTGALVAVAQVPADPACPAPRWWGEDRSACRAVEVLRPVCEDDTDLPDDTGGPAVCRLGSPEVSPVCDGTRCPPFDRLDRCARGRRDPRVGACTSHDGGSLDVFRFTAPDGSRITVWGDAGGAVVAVSRAPVPGATCTGWWGAPERTCEPGDALLPVDCPSADPDTDAPIDTARPQDSGSADTGGTCPDSGIGFCRP